MASTSPESRGSLIPRDFGCTLLLPNPETKLRYIPSSNDLKISVFKGGIRFSFPRKTDRSTFTFYNPDTALVESDNYHVTVELPAEGVTIERRELPPDWEELANSLDEDPTDFHLLHINITEGHHTNVVGFGLPYHAENDAVHGWVNEQSPIEGVATLSEILRLQGFTFIVRATRAELTVITRNLVSHSKLIDYGYGDVQTWDRSRYNKQVPGNRGPSFSPTKVDPKSSDKLISYVCLLEPSHLYNGRHWRAITRFLRGEFCNMEVTFESRKSTKHRTVTWEATHLAYGLTDHLREVDVTNRIPLGLIQPRGHERGHDFSPKHYREYPGVEASVKRDSIQLKIRQHWRGEKNRVDAINSLGRKPWPSVSQDATSTSRRQQAFNTLLIGNGLWDASQAGLHLDFPPLDLFKGVPVEVQQACIEIFSAEDGERIREYFSKLHFGFGLVSGPPGTGKSTLAAVLAMLMCSNDSIKSLYVTAGSNVATTNILDRMDEVATKVGRHLVDSGSQVKGLMLLRGFSYNEELNRCLDALAGAEFMKETSLKPARWRLKLSLCWWTLRALGLKCLPSKDLPSITSDDNQDIWSLHQELNKLVVSAPAPTSISKFKDLVKIAQGLQPLSKRQFKRYKPVLAELMVMVVNCANVVATTPAASKSDLYLPFNSNKARAVIFDEAATLFMSDGLMVFGNMPRPMIAIGDPKQLAPVLPTEIELLHNNQDLHEKYDQKQDGFPTNRFAKFASISWLTYFVHLGWPVFHLYTQIRMAEGLFDMSIHTVYVQMKPQIKYSPLCNLSNFPIAVKVEEYMKRVYRIPSSPVAGRLQPIFFHCVDSPCCNMPQKATRFNPRQVDSMATLLTKMIPALSLNPKDIAVLTPYVANRSAIRKRFNEDKNLKEIAYSTFDKFQGRDAPIVLVSLCVDRVTGPSFVANPRSLNVALTRQKSSLLIFGDVEMNGWEFREDQKAESKAEGSTHFNADLFRTVFRVIQDSRRVATLYGDTSIDLSKYCHRMQSSSQFQ
ncbi:hypothetical protein ACHAPU_011398 [Fusarium lateritium]